MLLGLQSMLKVCPEEIKMDLYLILKCIHFIGLKVSKYSFKKEKLKQWSASITCRSLKQKGKSIWFQCSLYCVHGQDTVISLDIKFIRAKKTLSHHRQEICFTKKLLFVQMDQTFVLLTVPLLSFENALIIKYNNVLNDSSGWTDVLTGIPVAFAVVCFSFPS